MSQSNYTTNIPNCFFKLSHSHYTTPISVCYI